MKPVKLTWKKVDQIRARYAAGEGGYGTLAKAYGVSNHNIKMIIKGKIWAPEKRPR